MHVDEFVEKAFNGSMESLICHGDGSLSGPAYAAWFFMLHRFPAYTQSIWHMLIAQYKLFCVYEGKKYRVTGASRLGDIWLTDDFSQDTGYKLRVDLVKCSEWSSI